MNAVDRSAFRTLLSFWLAGWFINAPGDPGFLKNFRDARALPLALSELPAFLVDPTLAFVCYLAPLALLAAWWDPARLGRAGALLMVVCSLFACFHAETCSDATFVSSLWVGLWALWFSTRVRGPREGFATLCRGCAHLVVALLFLGALLGKSTNGYWSGEVFHGLYFAHEPGFPYPFLRARFSPIEVREIATWFSRVVLVGEASLVLAPLAAPRAVLPLYVVTMLTMMLARNVHLFSVLGAPLGLLVAVELLSRPQRGAVGSA